MEKLEALNNWQNSPLYSDEERATLAYADSIVISGRQVSDEVFEQLRCHFDDEGIIELTGLIGYQTMSNIFNTTLQIPPQGLCKVPFTGEPASTRPGIKN